MPYRPERIPAKNKRDAKDRYVEFLQKTLSCVTNAQLYVGRPPRGDKEQHALTLSEGPAGVKRADGSRLSLAIGQLFHYVKDKPNPGEWKVSTDSYAYSLGLPGNGTNEFLAWNWHPPNPPYPHLHSCIRSEAVEDAARLHIPTGRVSVEAVIRFVIEELEAVPARDDWDEALAQNDSRFVQWRSWH